jgi:acetylornithine/succinyldiaminopimelate/putrescine aminotransferase
MIEREGLLARVRHLEELFRNHLGQLQRQCDLIQDVRVLGVMIGIELGIDGTPVVQACMERGLLLNCTHGTVIRLLPAMTLADEQVAEGCEILAKVLKELPATLNS